MPIHIEIHVIILWPAHWVIISVGWASAGLDEGQIVQWGANQAWIRNLWFETQPTATCCPTHRFIQTMHPI